MFTTYYRDYESGDDYAQARHYVNRLARFSAMDPVAGSLGNPQSLNRYSYVLNDPANLADPLGLDPCDGDTASGGCVSVSADAGDDGDNTSSSFAFGGMGDDAPPPLIYRGGAHLGWNPLLLGPMPQPPPPPGYKQCIEAALRNMVAHDEGMDNQPNLGYGTLVGGTVLTAPGEPWIEGQRYSSRQPWNMSPSDLASLRSHPYITVNAGVSISTAFGRYQFTVATWNQFGSGGMTPAAQNMAMNALMDKVGMTADAMAGQIAQAIWDGNTRWASLPDSPFNQPTKSWAETIAAFQNALNTLPECQ